MLCAFCFVWCAPQVRNGGATGTCGDSHANQAWCQGHIVGFDVDTVHYCWTYFESAKADATHALRTRESWARWALLSAGSAAPLFIEADCKASDEKPGTSLDKNIQLAARCAPPPASARAHTPAHTRGAHRGRRSARRYAHVGANYMCMTRGISGVGYPGKVWGTIGDTLHNTTREGEQVRLLAARCHRRVVG